MTRSHLIPHKIGRGVAAVAIAATLGATGVAAGTAYAAVPNAYWDAPSSSATISDNILKTYGVRAGSAGGDFLGITNTNFDFTNGKASQADQYTAYTSTDLAGVKGAGLALWATSVNVNPNPFYQNLYYNAVSGTNTTQATTWMSNPETSSWGDSNNSASNVGGNTGDTSKTTIAGLEFKPQIIFGASKVANWNLSATGSNSSTNMYTATSADSSYNPTYANNDATNLYTQIHTVTQLATTADNLTSTTGATTRYNNSNASETALAYEKVTRGQLLYVASQVDAHESDAKQGVKKKTVAYLYAVDADGTGHFFIPEASGLTNGSTTESSSGAGGSQNNPGSDYAANNSTINMGYMATLPFVTNTFKTSTTENILMKVEDIWKNNPACTVTSNDTNALKDVDVIICNSTTATDLSGTSGGKNSSGVNNDYAGDKQTWATSHGFTGSFIYGDDFGTSTNQGIGSESAKTGTAPLLYCQRNYTLDKDVRAAWAFSQVYPELYGNNKNATYEYWVSQIYHVKDDKVANVVSYMTNQTSGVTYDESVINSVADKADSGLRWWNKTGKTDSDWNKFAYYNGASRASYYGGGTDAQEPTDTIGVFAPSSLWQDSVEDTTVYRMYNDLTSEHLFTTDKSEYDKCGTGEYADWKAEGESWTSPEKGKGVYRLYNSQLGKLSNGTHIYTTDESEVKNLTEKEGWVADNNGKPIFYSAQDVETGKVLEGASDVMRLYNDGLSEHHFTMDQSEHDNLVDNHGWKDEATGFYAYKN